MSEPRDPIQPESEEPASIDDDGNPLAQPPLVVPQFRSKAPEMPEVLRAAPPPREAAPKKKKLTLIAQPSGPEMKAIGLGLEFVAMVGAGVLLGWGADALLGTRHWIIVGLVVGLLTGGWQLYKGGLRLNRELDRASGFGKGSTPTSKRPAEGSGHDQKR